MCIYAQQSAIPFLKFCQTAAEWVLGGEPGISLAVDVSEAYPAAMDVVGITMCPVLTPTHKYKKKNREKIRRCFQE